MKKEWPLLSLVGTGTKNFINSNILPEITLNIPLPDSTLVQECVRHVSQWVSENAQPCVDHPFGRGVTPCPFHIRKGQHAQTPTQYNINPPASCVGGVVGPPDKTWMEKTRLSMLFFVPHTKKCVPHENHKKRRDNKWDTCGTWLRSSSSSPCKEDVLNMHRVEE